MYRLAGPGAAPQPVELTGRPEMVGVLRSLRADDSCVVPVADTALRQEVDALLGVGPVAWAVDAARVAGARGVQSAAGDPSPPAYLRFCETLLVELLLQLAGGALPDDTLDRLQTELFRAVATSGLDVEETVATLRGVQRLWTGQLLDHAVAESAGPGVLREITVVVGSRFDHIVDRAMAQRAGRLGRPDDLRPERRRHLVESLVGDAPVDAGRLAAELRLDPRLPHLALVLTRRDGRPPQEDELDAAVGSAARALRAAVALRHETAVGALWVWLTGGTAADPAPRVEPAAFGTAPVRVGIGSSRREVTGLRRSHLEARDAHRMSTGRCGPVVHHADVAFTALLGRDPERARWFVSSQLGPLAEPDVATAELRQTLCAYYSSGMRLASTAAVLHLHRNTLVNRLHRIEKLLGRSVQERVAETHSALLLAEGIGPGLLHG